MSARLVNHSLVNQLASISDMGGGASGYICSDLVNRDLVNQVQVNHCDVLQERVLLRRSMRPVNQIMVNHFQYLVDVPPSIF